jgi:hypothetical protein
MLLRKTRRAAARIVEKILNREARADVLREINTEFGRQFRELNSELVELNTKFATARSPAETELLLRALALNYKTSSALLSRWADSLNRAAAIAKAGN